MNEAHDVVRFREYSSSIDSNTALSERIYAKCMVENASLDSRQKQEEFGLKLATLSGRLSALKVGARVFRQKFARSLEAAKIVAALNDVAFIKNDIEIVRREFGAVFGEITKELANQYMNA